MKIYEREVEFVNKFCAALKLSGNEAIDVVSLDKYMPILRNIVSETNMFTNKSGIDELHLLFMKDLEGKYSNMEYLLNHMDSVLEKDGESDCFKLIVDEENAEKTLSAGSYFPKHEMMDIASQIGPVIERQEEAVKVKAL